MLELARDAVAFRAVAAVHPAMPSGSSEDWAAAPGTVLLCTGSEDPLCTPDQLLAFGRVLQDAGVDWRATVYGGARHAFWHPPVQPDGTPTDIDEAGHARHHPINARRLWVDVLGLLAEHLPAG